MTRADWQEEANRVDQVFHAALTQLGVASLEEALALWQSIPPASMARARTTWLTRIVRILMGHRSEARSLGRAYYRLVRALRTGTTTADPYKPEPRYITLDILREEFEALVPTPGAQEPGQEPREDNTPTRVTPQPSDASHGDEEPAAEGNDFDEADRILVEELAEIEAEAERQEREAEREAQKVLDNLGPNNFNNKADQLDGSSPHDEFEAALNEAYRQAGARQAAAVERLVQNGARAEIWTNVEHDKRALGYVRYSTTGTPCGWCAMLISRGVVYKSAQSAEYDDGDKYHDNCHCSALPVFTKQQFENDPKYALNREYSGQWPDVTRGLSGKAAISAWRRFIRLQQRAQAQAAKASTAHVQEA
ncbi:hypothetical protein OG474_30060 [Kribbella sp. NBC_01505]|uniref:VG15 protein n=1 Tax=Kribbella sp. NBC_01505 TaxID=2903580 RepID=UPI00386AD81A